MLKKILKYLFLTLFCLSLLAVMYFGYASYAVDQRMSRIYEVEVPEMEISEDSASLALGAHLAQIKGCQECHGDDLGGKIMVDDPALGRMIPGNITRGKGGLPEDYSTRDWVRAIRHGLGRDNKALPLMPSQEFYTLTQKDLNAIIAYCRNVSPVDRELPEFKLRPLGVILTHLDKIPMFPAELVDHGYQMKSEIPNEISVENGQYLSVACTGCHRPDLKGGPAHLPGSPDAADITGSGNIGKWNEEQFIAALRTGRTPDGKELQNEFMPWKMTSAYTDVELKSLYSYLRTL